MDRCDYECLVVVSRNLINFVWTVVVTRRQVRVIKEYITFTYLRSTDHCQDAFFTYSSSRINQNVHSQKTTINTTTKNDTDQCKIPMYTIVHFYYVLVLSRVGLYL